MEEKKEQQGKEYEEALKNAAEKIISGNFSLREYYGISDDGLEAIYMVGHEMYKHKQYVKAKGVFALLCTLQPMSSKYLSACGSASFMAGDYTTAAQYFRMALAEGEYTPKMLMRLAECVIRLDQLDLAKKYIDELLTLANDDKFKNDRESRIYEARARMTSTMVEKELAKLAEEKKSPKKQLGKKR
ncbi:MAG: tetratricopeptide repeat protein [Puniceicoccales bacterium]|jgi:TolA-binding protein|nr:tetratricopeptide repeat protein [Puniceicoccales bacterium]